MAETKPEEDNSIASQRSEIASRTANLRDEFSGEMKRLTDAGAGTVAAMDFLMCSVGEVPYEEWAEARGVSQEAVRRNMKRVAQSLGETVEFKTRGD